MDAIQQGHITRTRELLERSSLSHDTKESLHDCLTIASQAANGCPPEDRAKHLAGALLALSNAMIRITVATPGLIYDGINQHVAACPQNKQSKPVLSWEGKGFLPGGSIRGGFAVMASVFLVICVLGYLGRLYFDYRAVASAAKSFSLPEQQAMEHRIVEIVLREVLKEKAVKQ